MDKNVSSQADPSFLKSSFIFIYLKGRETEKVKRVQGRDLPSADFIPQRPAADRAQGRHRASHAGAGASAEPGPATPHPPGT